MDAERELTFQECVDEIKELNRIPRGGLKIGCRLRRIVELKAEWKLSELRAFCKREFGFSLTTARNAMRASRVAEILSGSFRADEIPLIVDILKEIPDTIPEAVMIEFWRYVLDRNGGTANGLKRAIVGKYKKEFWDHKLYNKEDLHDFGIAKKRKREEDNKEESPPLLFGEDTLTEEDMILCLMKVETFIRGNSSPEVKAYLSEWYSAIQRSF